MFFCVHQSHRHDSTHPSLFTSWGALLSWSNIIRVIITNISFINNNTGLDTSFLPLVPHFVSLIFYNDADLYFSF